MGGSLRAKNLYFCSENSSKSISFGLNLVGHKIGEKKNMKVGCRSCRGWTRDLEVVRGRTKVNLTKIRYMQV